MACQTYWMIEWKKYESGEELKMRSPSGVNTSKAKWDKSLSLCLLTRTEHWTFQHSFWTVVATSWLRPFRSCASGGQGKQNKYGYKIFQQEPNCTPCTKPPPTFLQNESLHTTPSILVTHHHHHSPYPLLLLSSCPVFHIQTGHGYCLHHSYNYCLLVRITRVFSCPNSSSQQLFHVDGMMEITSQINFHITYLNIVSFITSSRANISKRTHDHDQPKKCPPLLKRIYSYKNGVAP